MYIEGILDRINLRDSIDSDGFKVLDGTLGEWLENHNPLFLNFFVSTAEGGYLDLIGKEYGMLRLENETDEDYRKRILLEIRIVESTADIMDSNITLWVYFSNILDKNILSSRNPHLKYLHDEPYVFLATGLDMDYIKNKFFVKDILWIE